MYVYMYIVVMYRLLVIILCLLSLGCNIGIENECSDGPGGYVWECECVGILIEEVPPLWGGETWFHCCNTTQDSCWYRILGN